MGDSTVGSSVLCREARQRETQQVKSLLTRAAFLFHG